MKISKLFEYRTEFNPEDRHNIQYYIDILQNKYGDNYDFSQITFRRYFKYASIRDFYIGDIYNIKNKEYCILDLYPDTFPDNLPDEINYVLDLSKNTKIKKDFIRRSKKYHGDKYSYYSANVDYKTGEDGKERVYIDDICCDNHADSFYFTVRADNWKQGCPKCAGRDLSDEDIVHKAETFYGSKYDYDDAWVNSDIFLKWFDQIQKEDNDDKADKVWTLCDEETGNAIAKGEKITKYIYDIYCPTHELHFHRPVSTHLKGQGCPKCAETKGEARTSNILNSLNIYHTTQKTFKDLKHRKKLRFDIYLPNLNACIEYDGEQHSKSILYWGGEENFKDLQFRDKLKDEYCKNNNIPLLRLTHNDNDTMIKSKIIEFVSKIKNGVKESIIIKFSKFKNL